MMALHWRRFITIQFNSLQGIIFWPLLDSCLWLSASYSMSSFERKGMFMKLLYMITDVILFIFFYYFFIIIINIILLDCSIVCYRIVRLTSPNLNYFILLGASLLYISVFLRLYPNTGWIFTEVICNVRDHMWRVCKGIWPILMAAYLICKWTLWLIIKWC